MASPDIRPSDSAQKEFHSNLKEPIAYNLEKRPNPYRPFTYAVFDHDPAYREVQEQMLRTTIISPDDANGYVLDLGCATGGNTKLLTQMYEEQGIPIHIIGADIDRSAISVAQHQTTNSEFVTHTYLQTDATKLALPDNSIRRVFFLGAFHEIQGKDETGREKKDLALEEVFRALEPGGELIIISGFTKEVFDFNDEITGKSARRTEFMKHGKIRVNAMDKLGQKKAKSSTEFELLGQNDVISKLQQAGFEIDSDNDVTITKGNMTIDSMRAIGEDLMWTQGTFQDMENTEAISPYAKREAYQQALDEMEKESHLDNSAAPLLFPRNFYMFRARKPTVRIIAPLQFPTSGDIL